MHHSHADREREFQSLNDVFDGLQRRMRNLEDQMESPNPSDVRMKEYWDELTELRLQLAENRQKVEKMQNKRFNSFAVAACLFFICFLVYGLYVLVNGV
ncbi:uncharacterized protein LOC128267930 [Anopheles cruzii]|uniref:uncharacterized protein LOC128267930 n=1 Tax=Anopheles cruzii TaxID=68878 RepID=UPI0022EC201C|nr:uncharacterized protein LOC128267930 [Anopheles cruzii]